MPLCENVAISYVAKRPANPGAGGSLNTASVNMTGYTGCLFIIVGGIMTTGASFIRFQPQQSSDDGVADAFANVGTLVDMFPAAASEFLSVVDISNPTEKFLRGVLTWNTANSAPNGVIAIRYGGRQGNLDAKDALDVVIAQPDLWWLYKHNAPT